MASTLYDLITFRALIAAVVAIAAYILLNVILAWLAKIFQELGQQVHEVTSGDTTMATCPPKVFKDFIQDVVKIFMDQCKQAKYEFAVLFLSAHRSLEDISDNTKFPIDSKATNRERHTFPSDKDLENYVTAGPQGDEHAEAILLGKLDTLMDKFGEDNCETIVLYTWLLPCDKRWMGCKDAIIKKLSPWVTKDKQVILVYTCKMQDVSNKEREKIVRDIEKKKIIVFKVIQPKRAAIRSYMIKY